MNTCNTCIHYSKTKEQPALCGRKPDPVTGQPVIWCNTERLVGIELAAYEPPNCCGHDAKFHHPAPPPKPTTIGTLVRDFGQFWCFWK